MAGDIRFSYNKSMDREANLLGADSMHSLYSLTNIGAKKIIGKPNSFSGRSAEIIFASLLGHITKTMAHEEGHVFTARVNGAYETEINNDVYWWRGNLNDAERIKVSTAGLDWVNVEAEKTINRNMGKKINVSELIWFGLNQVNAPGYVFTKTDTPEKCLDDCRYNTNDTVKWYGLVGKSDLDIMDKLYSDLKVGAAWQALGLFVPIYHGIKYWSAGKEYTMPNWWFNPQFDMTDVGVMYALSVWHKSESGTTVHLRPGFGKNRVESGHIKALEVELSIPYSNYVFGIRGGSYKTLKRSHSFGVSAEKVVSKNWSVGVDIDQYSGYHRKNPKANSDWHETLIFAKVSF